MFGHDSIFFLYSQLDSNTEYRDVFDLELTEVQQNLKCGFWTYFKFESCMGLLKPGYDAVGMLLYKLSTKCKKNCVW